MLFEEKKIQLNIQRASKQFSDTDRFLYRWAEDKIKERLKDIKREFKNIKIISDFPIHIENAQAGNKPPYDCVISIFNLHRTNTPEEQLRQIHKSLKPDGMFLGLFFGDATLTELKQSLTKTEINLSNGSHQRVQPFMSKQQVGALMQSSNFALPVIDSEYVLVDYTKINTLYTDLRAMGETNSLTTRSKKPVPKIFFDNLEKQYAKDFSSKDKFTATYEVIFCTGWTPDESQQKPLRPGSGKTSLKDVL
ncbi:MAG: class I SAM-dependent methyltransferase [Bdellovibrionales bacterium]